MTLSNEQQRAIKSPLNCIVSASAGSGKTRILSQRYLHYVIHSKTPVTNILALTFTRKAAEEMRSRIYQSLLRESHHAFVAQQIDLFEKARISTFDSFCVEIIDNAVDYLGINPHLSINHTKHHELSLHITYTILAQYSKEPIITRLLNAHGYYKLYSDLLRLVAGTYLFEIYNLSADTQCNRILAETEQHYHRSLTRIEESVNVLASTQYDRPAFCKMRDTLIENAEHLQLPALPQVPSSELTAVIETCTTLRPQLRNNIFGAAKGAEILQAKAAITQAKEAVTAMESLARICADIDNYHALYTILQKYASTIWNRKKSTGILTYADIPSLALMALRTHPEIQHYYSNLFKHILVDEFQDNNTQQRDLLLTLLAKDSDSHPPASQMSGHIDNQIGNQIRENSLFAVGDEKQSIYLFRGADTGVFQHIARQFTAPYAQQLALTTNYRSSAQLIAITNAIFGSIDTQEYTYVDIKPHWKGVETQKTAPVMELWQIEAPEDEDESEAPTLTTHESEAYYIAQYIHRAVENGAIEIMTDSGGRAPAYGDFAILLRTKTYQKQIERMFSYWGVPYHSHDPSSLFTQPFVSDIYYLIRLLVNSEDREAYATILHSPFVSLSDITIHTLMHQAIWANIEAHKDIAPQEIDAYTSFRKVIRDLQQRVSSLVPADIVNSMWQYYLYPHSPDTEEQELYEQCIALGAEYGHLYDFMNFLGTKIETKNSWQVAPTEDEGDQHTTPNEQSVQILTIHKAKGLEFPFVIMADSHNKGRAQTRPLCWKDDTLGCMVNIDTANHILHTQWKTRQAAREQGELLRLLYVALTRAQSHIIVSASLNKKSRQSATSLWDILTGALDAVPKGTTIPCHSLPLVPSDTYQTSPTRPHPSTQPTPSTPLDIPRTEYYYIATDINTRWIEHTPNTEPKHQHTKIAQKLEIDTHIQSDDEATSFGNLCHLLLEHYLVHSSSQSIDALIDRVAAAPLTTIHGSAIASIASIFGARNFPIALESARVLMHSTMADPLFIEILTHATHVAPEVSFYFLHSAHHNNYYIYGSIDCVATVVTPHKKHCYILDFKSDVAYHDSRYIAQVACYYAAAQKKYQMEIIPVIYWLRHSKAQYPQYQQHTLDDILSTINHD